MTLTTWMLTPESRDDFASLVEANNGARVAARGIAFHPEGVVVAMTAPAIVSSATDAKEAGS